MPIVTIAMYSGKTRTEKDRLAEAITEDVAKVWHARISQIGRLNPIRFVS